MHVQYLSWFISYQFTEKSSHTSIAGLEIDAFQPAKELANTIVIRFWAIYGGQNSWEEQ